MGENKSVIKILIIWIVCITLLLCISTLITFWIHQNENLKITYKGNTSIYKIDDLHWDETLSYSLEDMDGETYNFVEGYYLSVENDILRKYMIWSFDKITYVFKDGSKVVFDSDEYYIEKKDGAGETHVGDLLKKEKNNSITLYHCCYEYRYEGATMYEYDMVLSHRIEYKNLKEIIIYPVLYK